MIHYRIDSESVGASVHPICQYVLHLLHDHRVSVVQVGLANSKLVQIILLSLLIPSPRTCREDGLLFRKVRLNSIYSVQEQ